MKSIVTLTMNPTIDADYEVEQLRHTQKMRTLAERYAPGGGGINVARVFVRLGGNARCCYLSGGATGPALDGLVDLHQLARMRIPIAGHTRVAVNTLERHSGKEYRFVPPGPEVSEAEWTACLDKLAATPCDILVASGSLPPGVPADFYARLAKNMAQHGTDIILDTSGEALRAGLAGGTFLLAKPSLDELRQIAGAELEGIEDIARAAGAIVTAGKSTMVAVTLGHRGAILASREGAQFLAAPQIEPKSAVGAGDSFVAAMVYKLACGSDPFEAFRYGMAAGAAAVLTPGTDLAYPADIADLDRQLQAVVARPV